MTIQRYKNLRFTSESEKLLDECARVIEVYRQQQLKLSLRPMGEEQ